MIEQYINNIYNEDCLEFMKRLPDKSIDMILCDLPYGTTACKWDTIIPLEPMWEAYKRIIKDNGAIVLTASQPFTSKLVMSNLKMFKYELVWNKMIGGNFVQANKRILPSHENILVFYKTLPTYNPQKTKKDKSIIRPNNNGSSGNSINSMSVAKNSIGYDNITSFPVSILNYSSKMQECNSLNRVHPTQKPVALFSYLIKTYTNENDIVLDNCSGSGTTAISCLETNRKYICCELDSNYYDISLKRIDDYNKQVKLF